MSDPAARGQRFLAVAEDHIWIKDVAAILKRRMGAAARRVPSGELPSFLVRMVAHRDAAVAQIVPELGKYKNSSNEKARRVLGWAPRSNEEALVATAESMMRLGLLRGSRAAAS